MVQYVRKNVPLISKELMSIDDVEAFVDRTDYSVIGEFISAVSLCKLCYVSTFVSCDQWH